MEFRGDRTSCGGVGVGASGDVIHRDLSLLVVPSCQSPPPGDPQLDGIDEIIFTFGNPYQLLTLQLRTHPSRPRDLFPFLLGWHMPRSA